MSEAPIARWNWPSRLRAAGIHLAVSALLATLAAALVFLFWFPYPYRVIAGGQDLFWLMVSVDVVLGPMLTLVVFNLRKPRSELIRDLFIIGSVQMAALAYGLWSVYESRPVYLVHEVDRLVAVAAADVDPADLPNAEPAFRKLPFVGVPLIGLRDIRNGEERMKSFELALAGKDLSLRPEYWQPLSEANREVIRQRAKPLQVLVDRSEEDARLVNQWLQESKQPIEELTYLPLTASKTIWTAVLRADSLEIVGYLPIDSF
ncbi:TfpX/TfpZ family type IV pilin accessory protein [Hydrogenophaga sp. 5NK40-0174]|uniref:TfpX/TfpZ family type IV pilin accessory protein n=1 Tax=Hydrogenophaga sp. 5NK40-0174 TaxID=3127649 RepID=UPI00310973EB